MHRLGEEILVERQLPGAGESETDLGKARIRARAVGCRQRHAQLTRTPHSSASRPSVAVVEAGTGLRKLREVVVGGNERLQSIDQATVVTGDVNDDSRGMALSSVSVTPSIADVRVLLVAVTGTLLMVRAALSAWTALSAAVSPEMLLPSVSVKVTVLPDRPFVMVNA